MSESGRVDDERHGGNQEPSEPALRSAEALFLDWLDRRDGRDPLDLRSLIAENPAHADALRAMHRGLVSIGGESLLVRATANDADDALVLPVPGDSGARYAHLGEFARGGMGSLHRVFDTSLGRHVAMKVVLAPSTDDRDRAPDSPRDTRTIGRFLEEARITAQLEHPGVVPVHELGRDDHGRVYFTMRLVRGDHLGVVLGKVRRGEDGWSQVRALGVLLRVCEALAYAHSRGVVHRDVKPSNIMVGPFGEAYVMDWGLARVTGSAEAPREGDPRPPETASPAQRGPDVVNRSPVLTRDGDVLGTPAYMAPEQARGDLAAIGPAADVYGVGAILYELLTGSAPYADTRARSPATVVDRATRRPPTSVERLAPAAPAALVAICERAMARAPEDRYADMRALAEDLRAFLEHRVVTAYRTGPVVELTTWVRRNRALAAALVAVVILVVGGLAFVSWRERSAAAAIAAERDDARAMADFQKGVLRIDPWDLGEDPSPLGLLHRATEQIGRTFRARPALEAEARQSLGGSLGAFGDFAAAEAQLRRAWELYRELEGPRADDTIAVQIGLSGALRSLGRLSESEALLREVLRVRGEAAGPDDDLVLLHTAALIAILCDQGRHREAAELADELLPRARRSLAAEGTDLAHVLTFVATAFREVGRLDDALALRREVLDIHRAVGPDDSRDVLTAKLNLARILIDTRAAVEGEALARDVLERSTPVRGEDHPDTLDMKFVLLLALEEQGRLDEAAALGRAVYEARHRTLGPDNPDTWDALNRLAAVLLTQRKAEEAFDLLDAALAGSPWERLPTSTSVVFAVERRAVAASWLSRREDAVRDAELAVALHRAASGPEHPNTHSSEATFALMLRRAGRPEEAEEALRGLIARMTTNGEGERARFGDVLGDHADLLLELGRPEEALSARGHAVDVYAAALGTDAEKTMRTRHLLGVELERAGRYRDSIEVGVVAYRGACALFGIASSRAVAVLDAIATRIRRHGDIEQARALALEHADRYAAFTAASDGPPSESDLGSGARLAETLVDCGELERAEALARAVHDQAIAILGVIHPVTLSARNELARALLEQGRLDEGLELTRDLLEARRLVLGPLHDETWASIGAIARALLLAERHEEAAAFLDEALADRPWEDPAAPSSVTAAVERRAIARGAIGRYDEAIDDARLAIDLRRSARGPDHDATRGAERTLVSILLDAGRAEEAEATARQILDALALDHSSTTRRSLFLEVSESLAGALDALGRFEDAVGEQRRVVDAYEASPEVDDPDRAGSVHRLGKYLEHAGRSDESIAVGLEAVDLLRGNPGASAADTLAALGVVSRRITLHGDHAQAERVLREHLALVRGDEAATREVHRLLADLYDAWGRPTEAERWRPDDGGESGQAGG